MHLISRVVDQEFRIDDEARENYLSHVRRVAPRVKWTILAYALMSNHVHWALLCLGQAVRQLIHPVHTGFGGWLNGRDKRLTPVFAGRPATHLYEPDIAPGLIAYIHNNPVRAQVVTNARASTWTSHRAYVGDSVAPKWLDVRTGLELCGLQANPDGRASFAAMVAAAARKPKDSRFSGQSIDRERRLLRRRLNAPIELATPHTSVDGVEWPLIGVPGMPVTERWGGDVEELVAAVAIEVGLSAASIRSRTRARTTTRARTLVLLVGTVYLGRTIKEISAAVGLTNDAGSKLLVRNPGRCEELGPIAQRIAAQLRAVESASPSRT